MSGLDSLEQHSEHPAEEPSGGPDTKAADRDTGHAARPAEASLHDGEEQRRASGSGAAAHDQEQVAQPAMPAECAAAAAQHGDSNDVQPLATELGDTGQAGREAQQPVGDQQRLTLSSRQVVTAAGTDAAAEATLLLQHAARAQSAGQAGGEGEPGPSSSRPNSGQGPGVKALRALSRQSSLARSTAAPTPDDSFVLSSRDGKEGWQRQGEGQATTEVPGQPPQIEHSDSSLFSGASDSPPLSHRRPTTTDARLSSAQNPGSSGQEGLAPGFIGTAVAAPGSSASFAPRAASAGGLRQGSRSEQAQPTGQPPAPRLKGAAPFMERHAPPGALKAAKRDSNQEDRPGSRPLKGLAAKKGSLPEQQQAEADKQQQQQATQPVHLGPQSVPGTTAPLGSPPLRLLKPSTSNASSTDGKFGPFSPAPCMPAPLGGLALPTPAADGMENLFMVRGLKDRHVGPLMNQQHRAKKAGKINFRNLFGPPAHTGGGTLPPAMIKEGLRKRAAAAAAMARGPPPFVRKPEPRPITPEGVKLDGFMMLEAGDEDLPEHVIAAKLSHRNISSIEMADMAYFPALKVLDLSDNKVPGLDGLTNLLALRQLSLASNQLRSLGEVAGEGVFRELQHLDLSFNRLKPSVLGVASPLTGLPNLRELDLSSNSLTHLPEEIGQLALLSLLRLNHNRLSGAALVPLGALPALRELSLSGNVVTAVYEDVAEPTNFPQLRLLDLTNNKIAEESAVAPLRLLPSLRLLLLAGNPLAVLQQAAAKRAKDKQEVLRPDENTFDTTYGLQTLYQPLPDLPPKISIATILAAHSHRVPKAMDSRAVTKAAGEAIITATSDEALMEAFDRVDNAIDAWQLNTVDEEDEEGSGQEDTGPMEEDGTFLTGIGIEERQKRPSHKKEEAEAPAIVTVDAERPLWEDVTDPTERLALALGLDPRQLAISTGRLTTDSVGAINALRFALTHPLVEANDGLRPAQHHLGMTTAAKLKRRDRKLAPLAHGAAAAALPPADIKTVRIQTIESMLLGMKERLKGLENSLADKLAVAHRVGSVAAGSRSKGVDGLQSDDDDATALPETPGSPQLAGQHELDDARSDMSPLPDDVVDAIENPALSDSDDDRDNYLNDEVDQDAVPELSPRLTNAGAGPMAAASNTDGPKHADLPASATNALGYS